jgi:hypothetical protein
MKYANLRDFEILRHYNMARAALRLPNSDMIARENVVRITLGSGREVWDSFVRKGLARQRKPVPGLPEGMTEYELTEFGIVAALKPYERRGEVMSSLEKMLVPLDMPLGGLDFSIEEACELQSDRSAADRIAAPHSAYLK